MGAVTPIRRNVARKMKNFPKAIQDRKGLDEMADFLRDGKMKGAAMVFSTLPERDQELILAQMLKHIPKDMT